MQPACPGSEGELTKHLICNSSAEFLPYVKLWPSVILRRRWEGKEERTRSGMEYAMTLSSGVNFTPGWNQGAAFQSDWEFSFANAKTPVNFEPFSTVLSLVITPAKKCKWVWCLWEHLNGLDGSIDRGKREINVALKDDINGFQLLPAMDTLISTVSISLPKVNCAPVIELSKLW